MGKNSRKSSAPAPRPPSPAPTAAPQPVPAAGQPGDTDAPFYERHPTASNVIFAGVCVYVAMIWLLALDQTFHWGIWGPQGMFLWKPVAGTGG